MAKNDMKALSVFAAGLAEKIVKAANTLKRQATMELVVNLTTDTPIDTGAAISNWQVTVGAPTELLIEPYAPSVAGIHAHHSRGDISGKQANAEAAIMAAQSAVTSVEPGQALFITNNDPAVWATDTGHTITEQTTPGYVGRAIFNSIDVMKGAKLGTNG